VNAIPVQVVIRVLAGTRAGHATPRLVVVVVQSFPTRAATNIQAVFQSWRTLQNMNIFTIGEESIAKLLQTENSFGPFFQKYCKVVSN
jgi:hypothetical protein